MTESQNNNTNGMSLTKIISMNPIENGKIKINNSSPFKET